MKMWQIRHIKCGSLAICKPRSFCYHIIRPEIGILDGGERLGKFIGRYREAYFKASSMNPSTGVVFQYKPREGAEELIYQRISDITISMKALDYLHMPDCIPSRYEVEMSAPERELYDMLRKDLLIPLKDGDIDAANAASLTDQNRRCSMADEMDYMEQAKELADSYRLLVRRRDLLRQQYEDSRSWFYTKDEIIYDWQRHHQCPIPE